MSMFFYYHIYNMHNFMLILEYIFLSTYTKENLLIFYNLLHPRRDRWSTTRRYRSTVHINSNSTKQYS